MKVGIVGCGHVGTAMKLLFPNAVVFDKYKHSIASKDDINSCDAAFVCVPTPQMDSGECDTSAVTEVLEWLDVDITIIRSTVPVGYTDEMSQRLHRDIVFQPEYYGETVDHPFADLRQRQWLTFGGTPRAINKAITVYQDVYNADIQIFSADAKTVELSKYMENAFLALKVTFCNEFYDIAQAFNIDYNQLREAWTLDPRIGRSHTFVYEKNRGFGGSCLPKDLSAIICLAERAGADVSLLKAVSAKNNEFRGK